jgi:hypothetical protein
VAFWLAAQCSPVGGFWNLKGKCYFFLQDRSWSSEYGSSMFFTNVDIRLQDCTVSKTLGPQFQCIGLSFEK